MSLEWARIARVCFDDAADLETLRHFITSSGTFLKRCANCYVAVFSIAVLHPRRYLSHQLEGRTRTRRFLASDRGHIYISGNNQSLQQHSTLKGHVWESRSYPIRRKVSMILSSLPSLFSLSSIIAQVMTQHPPTPLPFFDLLLP
jgi:hypothetical protein